MQCTNKLKQIGIGYHNHHDIHNSFPAGGSPQYKEGTTTNSTCRRVGWAVFLLPFLEQAAAYQEIVTGGMAPPWTAATTATYYNVNIPTLLCPSDALAYFTAGQPAKCSYRGCAGDAWNKSVYSTAPMPRGLFGFAYTATTYFNMNAITDGTSNTVAFSEAGIGQGESGTDKLLVVNAIAYNSSHGDPTGTSGTPRDCFNRKGAGGILSGSAGSGNDGTDASANAPCGRSFADGAVHATGFHTILPPNSPSCFTVTGYSSGATDGNPLMSASSYHSGGVNICLTDGSVRFVSETINCGDIDVKPETSGFSKYGIWGGLGSKNGGESTTF
jgi:prepilin-type processing-associated H-X9-DG protein